MDVLTGSECCMHCLLVCQCHWFYGLVYSVFWERSWVAWLGSYSTNSLAEWEGNYSTRM
jgi:hypothetical protein